MQKGTVSGQVHTLSIPNTQDTLLLLIYTYPIQKF